MSRYVADRVDASKVEAAVGRLGLRIGRPVHVASLTGSTNTDAIDAARAGAPHGAVFLAEEQSNGRGRDGRLWLSPPGQNVYASIVLRPPLPATRLPSLTLAVGLAVSDVVASLVGSARVGVKWPNDVWVGSRKVAGILLEATSSGATCEFVVAGIGLNVLQTQFDASIAATATSLLRECSADLDRNQIVVDLLRSVDVRVEAFVTAGLSPMLADLQARDVTRNRRVCVAGATGIARGIAPDGSLRVETEAGRMTLARAGELMLLE